jgi:hypothetical protein
MAWTQNVGLAVDRLVAALHDLQATTLDGTDVLDGPVVSGSTALKAITIGYQPEDTLIGVDGESDREDMTAGRSRGKFSINCQAAVLAGSTEQAAVSQARRDACGLVDIVGGALADDPKLGGAVMSAQITHFTMAQAASQKGPLVVMAFVVGCDAFSQR